MKDAKRIIIVEDDAASAALLRSFFDRYASESGYNFDVKVFSDGRTFLERYDFAADIILMDIDLPGENGMEIMRKLRKQDENVVVIFVTNLAQYAVEGYSVDALDFVVKPVTYYNFTMKMKRAIVRSDARKDMNLEIILKGGGKKYIDVSGIRYVEVMNHTLCFHTAAGNYTSTGSMTRLCEQLAGFPFALCNRCYLVNLRYVEGTSQYEVVVDGQTLQISHLKRREFMRKLNLYLSGDALGND